MPPRALGSGSIAFGLVSIPVKLFPAAVSQQVAFHLLHTTCGSRIKNQAYCPVCDRVVERNEIVRGYEHAKGQYVRFSQVELDALEGKASRQIDIAEFVPAESVDPVYLDKTYYLGPDKGGAKPYQLLVHALQKAERVAIARYILRGKESLVMIRPAQDGLMLHTMFFHDEVRDFGEIDKGERATFKEGELGLAGRLLGELSHAAFDPERYEDEHRQRVLALVEKRAEGQEVTVASPGKTPAKVIDLMEALKQSLEKRKSSGEEGPARRPLPRKALTKVPRRISAAPKRDKAARATARR